MFNIIIKNIKKLIKNLEWNISISFNNINNLIF